VQLYITAKIAASAAKTPAQILFLYSLAMNTIAIAKMIILA